MSATPLLLLGLFGVYCTFYLVEASGTNALIHDSIAAAKLPNSDVSLRTVYTGFNPLDSILTYIVVLLWPVTDLQNALLLTLHTTTFLTGTNAIWTLLLLEGYRKGNLKTVSSFPIIFTLLGQLAFPVGISLYCGLHLATSITVHSPTRRNLAVPRPVLNALLVTTALGLIIPVTVLHAPVSHDTKQIFIAAWQFWPICSSMSIFFAHAILSTPNNTSPFQTDADIEVYTNTETETDKCTLRLIYGLCLLTTAIPHVRYMYPLVIFIVRQVVFTGRVQLPCLQDILDLLVWKLWSWDASPAPVGRVDEGLHIFLAWSYLVTSLAVLIWAGALYRSFVGRYGYGKLAVVAVLAVLVGPVAAAVELLWEREETVISGRASSLDRPTSTAQSAFRSKSGSGMGKWERGGKVLRFD